MPLFLHSSGTQRQASTGRYVYVTSARRLPLNAKSHRRHQRRWHARENARGFQQGEKGRPSSCRARALLWVAIFPRNDPELLDYVRITRRSLKQWARMYGCRPFKNDNAQKRPRKLSASNAGATFPAVMYVRTYELLAATVFVGSLLFCEVSCRGVFVDQLVFCRRDERSWTTLPLPRDDRPLAKKKKHARDPQSRRCSSA